MRTHLVERYTNLKFNVEPVNMPTCKMEMGIGIDLSKDKTCPFQFRFSSLLNLAR